MIDRELKRARKSLARGRVDEALVLLWNALDPARLEGARALRELERLAIAVGERGDEGQQREAQRLLEAVRETPAESDWIEQSTVLEEARPGGDTHDAVPAEAPPEIEREAPVGRGLGRYAIPAIFLLIVLVNVLARVLGGD
jgi:hypothetical protein